MSASQIQEVLVKKGFELFKAPRTLVEFTEHVEANKLLNDIERVPHAYVLACVMDRQVKAEVAWLIPYRMIEKLGDFNLSTLQRLSPTQVEKLMTKPSPLHRFPSKMSELFFLAVKWISEKYNGDASLIWAETPSSATVVYRFLEFKGVGPKIATMATNILARNFKIPFSDYYSIDVSPDVHVRRVLMRLRFTPTNATNEQVIYCARALHPEFPGLLDFPLWEIGRKWCRPRQPDCSNCYMRMVCPSAICIEKKMNTQRKR